MAFERTLAGIGVAPYSLMWGNSPVACTGSLRDYDVTNRLAELSMPALFTCGTYDLAASETIAHYRQQLAGAQIATFEHSSNTPQLEEPEAYVSRVGEFLQRTDNPAG